MVPSLGSRLSRPFLLIRAVGDNRRACAGNAPSPRHGSGSSAIFLIAALIAAGVLTICGCISSHTDKPPIDRRAVGEGFSSLPEHGRIEHVSQSNFDQKVLQSDVPVLVDFYADWCGPCKKLAPVLEQLAGENPHARIVKVNVDESPDLAARYGVSSIPSLKLFKNGQVAEQLAGLASKSQVQRLLIR
jgi:thioredoxin 1